MQTRIQSTRFFNISRAGTPGDSTARFPPSCSPRDARSSLANCGSRPTTSSYAPRNRESVSAPHKHCRVPRSRAGLLTAAPNTPAKTTEGYKYLRRRAVSPGTMRHNQIKDDLALLMKKHKDQVENEQAREERHRHAEQDRTEWEEMMTGREGETPKTPPLLIYTHLTQATLPRVGTLQIKSP